MDKRPFFRQTDIILRSVSFWIIPLLGIFRYFKFNIYYLYIDANSAIKKNKIASKLKKINIFPVPIEFEKNILPRADCVLGGHDPDEFIYSNNLRLIPDSFLDKYCNLFSIDKKRKKVLRILFQEFLAGEPLKVAFFQWLWSSLYQKKKIIYVSFSFKCFFIPKTDHGVSKIILPLNIFNYFIKFFLYFFNFIKKDGKQEGQISNRYSFYEIEKKNIAFVTHKGIAYNPDGNTLYEKSLYYSKDTNSFLNKYNLLHLDYSDFRAPERNIYWVCLNKIKFSNIKVFFNTLLACVKTFYLIRSWPTFLGWLLCMHKYKTYIKYCEIVKKFKNYIILALMDMGIKQEIVCILMTWQL